MSYQRDLKHFLTKQNVKALGFLQQRRVFNRSKLST